MFSGIITHKLQPKVFKKTSTSIDATFQIPKGWKLTMGESINVNGVCSTVKKLTPTTFSVFYMHETLKKTNLTNVTEKSWLNFERCLTLQDLIGGHLVYGHVDTTAEVIKVVDEGESKVITFKLPEQFTRYIVYKGSITVNGVSLTVIEVTKDTFSVSLIPHTLQVTNFGELKVKDIVNIEVDMMAKHLEKLIHKKM